MTSSPFLAARRRIVLSLLAAAALGSTFTPALAAEAYPDKPIRMLVTTPPGSTPDIIARVIGDQLGQQLHQPVIVENKPGGGGIISMNQLRRATPDGYTISMVHAAVATVTPLTFKAADYDIDTDFDNIGMIGVTPMVYVSNPAFPAKTLKDAIALAKAKPDTVTMGSSSRTSIPHLANEYLASKAGATFQIVPFSNASQGIQAVMGNNVSMYADGIASVVKLVQAGRLHALAVAADTVLPGLEGIPLAKDTVPGLTIYGWFMIAAPKGTPPEVVTKLNTALNRALAHKEVIARLQEVGTYPRPGTPAAAVKFVQSEKTLFGGIIRDLGIQPE